MSEFTFLNQHRVRYGQFATDDSAGFNGLFELWSARTFVRIIASDGKGWKHVSVSLPEYPNTVPKWAIMCHVKDLFFEPEDCVVQYHPKRSEYINNHRGCLHLWMPTEATLPRPPVWMVGIVN